MKKHWEHTVLLSEHDYHKFSKLNEPINVSVEEHKDLPFNTAVYVECESGGKRLEGIYDPTVNGIRKLRNTSAPNRDLRLYLDTILSDHITVIAVDGLMGSGKTSTCVKSLIEQHLSNVKLDKDSLFYGKPNVDAHKILICKPAVNASGEEYGFLPGDINEKIDPTIKNFTQYFDRYTQFGYEALKMSGYVEILPLGFVRGLDAEDVTLVIDECQNTKELVTVATRGAKNSRTFLLGDTSPFQIDLDGNTPEKNGLTDIIDLLHGAKYFQYIEMKTIEHIVRSEQVRDVVKRLFRKYGENPRKWII